ncbi:MAG: hypothetical protein HUU37_10150, partial [Bdellovibrionales bacterium]|nr:hypothetical protein [Bdellovibrionales bacterium]
ARAARRKEGNLEAIQERAGLRTSCIETAANDLDDVASKSRSKDLKERNESISNKIESLAEACQKSDSAGAEGVCNDLAEELDSFVKKSKSGDGSAGDFLRNGGAESAE